MKNYSIRLKAFGADYKKFRSENGKTKATPLKYKKEARDLYKNGVTGQELVDAMGLSSLSALASWNLKGKKTKTTKASGRPLADDEVDVDGLIEAAKPKLAKIRMNKKRSEDVHIIYAGMDVVLPLPASIIFLSAFNSVSQKT